MVILQPQPEPIEPKKGDSQYYNFPCPKCKAKKVQRFAYGYISNADALSMREVPGGCCIDEDSPKWCCDNCKYEWGRNSSY